MTVNLNIIVWINLITWADFQLGGHPSDAAKALLSEFNFAGH